MEYLLLLDLAMFADLDGQLNLKVEVSRVLDKEVKGVTIVGNGGIELDGQYGQYGRCGCDSFEIMYLSRPQALTRLAYGAGMSSGEAWVKGCKTRIFRY